MKAQLKNWPAPLMVICSLLFGLLPINSNAQQRPRRVKTQEPASSSPSITANTNPGTKRDIVDDEEDIVRIDTQLVTVPVAVVDHNGRALSGLRQSNFVLYEDGKLQQISNFATTEAPFEVALLLDTSGSTRADVELIRSAANLFINSLKANDRVSILAFNTQKNGTTQLASVDLKTDLTNDRNILYQALQEIGSSSGTPFYDSLLSVANQIFKDPPNVELLGRRALVALTDGVDSTSSSEYMEARAALLRRGIACYFIQVNTEGFVEDRLLKDCEDNGILRLSRIQLQRYRRIFAPYADSSDYTSFCRLGPFQRMEISRALYNLARNEMNDLAKASGGRSFNAEILNDARAAFAQVAADIGTQYSLGYYPTNKAKDGRFRTIRVEIKGIRGAKTRAREGYYPSNQ
jgi:Ca-activated chloride channel homolog